MVLGLGPLVRPELGLMMVSFLVAWFVLASPRRVTRDLAMALAVPIGYQIFRMGYFASLVPSTALAKDSGGLHVGQGWRYLKDLVGDVLAVDTDARDRGGDRDPSGRGQGPAHPRGVGRDAPGRRARHRVHGRDRRRLHARPVAAPGAVRRRRPCDGRAADRRARSRPPWAKVGALAVAAVWSLVVVVTVRYPAPRQTLGLTDIADWRLVLQKQMFHRPGQGITISPYEVRAMYAAGTRGFMRILDTEPRPGRDPNRLAVMLGSIGVPAYVAGHDVFIVDIGGLAEPLAARTTPIANRPAGHRKQVNDQWYWARFGVGGDGPRIRAARQALQCQPIRGLIDAIDEPLTPGRFVSNLWHATPYTFIHIPKNPIVAVRMYC